VIGPLQGLFYDWAGESFGWVDADEQDWYASFGSPYVRLGWERVVDPDQRVLPGVSDDAGELVAGMEGDRREVDHWQVGDLKQGGRGCERVQDSVHVEQEQGEAGGHCPLIEPPPGRAGKSPAGRAWLRS
jgi:hypothetical protein